MSPFEVMYGRKCHTPSSWSGPEDRIMLGPYLPHGMEYMVRNIKKNLKETQEKKYYIDLKRTHIEFQDGELVYIKL